MTLMQIRTGRIQEYPDSPRPLDQRNSQMHVQKDAALRAELAKLDALSAAGKTALTGS